jgi:very-short-patch-repair endonuclease
MVIQLRIIAQDCPKVGEYEREYRFHPKRRWRFDFAWPGAMIAVECNGGTWGNGRHNNPTTIGNDYEKLNAAALLGWRVLQFTSDQIANARYIERVVREILK